MVAEQLWWSCSFLLKARSLPALGLDPWLKSELALEIWVKINARGMPARMGRGLNKRGTA